MNKLIRECENCKKKTLWFLVRHRDYYESHIKQIITSKNRICGSCARAVQKLLS